MEFKKENIKGLISELTLEEKASLCAGEDFWHTKAIERLGIPSMMMCDGPHGLRKQDNDADHLGINESIRAVCFPTAAALAASFDRDLMSTLGHALGKECQAADIGMLLGPGMNIKRSPLCGRNFEYFSEDPYVTGELAASYVSALQSEGISTCAKHFAANNQEHMRMSGNSVVDERTLHEIYLSGFETMVKKSHPAAIMCSYNQVNGTFSSENKTLLTDILRTRWGFDGCVVTDWGAVKDRLRGLQAGLDLEMPGPGGNAQKIVDAVKSHKLEEAYVDRAAEHVLCLIARAAEQFQPNTVWDYEKDHRLAGEIASQCAVLLKNAKNLLPLSRSAKVAFIGEFAFAPRYQGSGSSHINSWRVTSPLEAAKDLSVTYAQGYRTDTEETDDALLQEAVNCARAAETAVIFAGLPDSSESEGFDRRHMEMPCNHNELIRAVAAVNPNTVVVLLNGSPVTMPWLDQVSAVLEMYLGGENAGGAAVSLLYGDINPSGKLAETFPLKLSDTPSFLNFPGENGRVEYHEGIYVGYRYYDKKEMEVLFPFGHGLSYTSFSYSDLKLSADSLRDTESLTVSCKIKNTGSRTGKEVLQLYVTDQESSVHRPVRELKGFCKVELSPGEEKEVTFVLDKNAFAYYEPRVADWFVESGRFTVSVGSSSRDLRLSADVEVTGSREIPVVFHIHSTLGEIFKTQKGMQVLGSMLQSMQKKAAGPETAANGSDQSMVSMGAGAEGMKQAMLNDMPLSALAAFVGMNDSQLHDIVAALNS